MSQVTPIVETTQLTFEAAFLPDGWHWARMGDIGDVVNGYGFAEHLQGRTDLPFPFIKVSDMNAAEAETVISKAANTVDEAMLKQLGARTYPAGTVIFPKVGGALLTNKKRLLGVEATFDNNIMGIVPKEVNSQFLFYWMLSFDLRTLANVQALPSIRQSDVAALKIPLPPSYEQKRIAAILKGQMAAVERARAAAEAQLKAAKDLPAAYLREVFESPEAEKWQKKRIDEFAQTCSGSTPSRTRADYYTGTISWVKTGELKDGFISDTEEHVSETALQECSIKLLPADTLLIAMYGQGQTRGRTGLLTRPSTTNQACFAVLPNADEFDSQYLQLWFRHNYSRLRRETEGRGGNQPNLNGEMLNRLQVHLPTLEEQRHITETVANQLMRAEQARERLQDQLDSINKLPAALLRQAFTGKL